MVKEWKINGKEIEKFHFFLLREIFMTFMLLPLSVKFPPSENKTSPCSVLDLHLWCNEIFSTLITNGNSRGHKVKDGIML